MKTKERIIWITLLILVITISVFNNYRYQNNLNILTYKNEKLSIQNTNLSQNNVTLLNELNKYKEIGINFPGPLSAESSGRGPEAIISDIKQHNELIPYEGVLGGKMGFYDDKKIFILNDRWVSAWFDDGHIAGYMLLKYKLNRDYISWEVIDSYLSNQ